jgi:hypothetical protein
MPEPDNLKSPDDMLPNLWLNGTLGRPHLAFAELVDW